MTKKDELEIRYADESLAPYLREWFKEPGVTRWYPFQEPAEIEDTIKMLCGFTRWKCGLTAFIDNEPVGMGFLFLHAYKKIAHQCLFALFVDAKHRNKGVGTNLLINIEKLAKENFNIEVLYLEVFEENPAISLYRRMGYKEVGYHRYWLKEDDGRYRSKIVMEKVLK